MKRIAIDMDDVMADASGRFMEYAKLKFGIDVDPIDLHEKSWAECVNVHNDEIR